MQYKTMCLQMIQDRPEMYDQLLSNRTLLPTLQRYAIQLRESHLAWKEWLAKAHPARSETQIASEALEFALKELKDSFPQESPPQADDHLDAAMAFITSHTPPA